VHLYTAAGAVLAFLALDAIGREAYAAAFGWMATAMLIDCTDGTLARRVRVKDVLPEFDGAKLDDIVDYLNYVLVPVVLIYRAGLVPSGAGGCAIAALPLLASAYGFCESEAKTPDHFFTGFPSYWNVVALYLFALGWSHWTNAGVLVALSVLVFVPIRYLYPSRTATARSVTYVGGVLWGVSVAALLLQFPRPAQWLALLSLTYPTYYVALSLWLHWRTPASPRNVGTG
jgi:phosphatidylcholine synthase